ncbi:MAG: hypothetical protein KAI47_15765, partial [Deltaproteobacteria bacterium]|nr:hypothetical protein [Deltaproteobacteria bacterium]
MKETFDGCEFEVNKSAAVMKLDVLPFGTDKGVNESGLDGVLFRGRSEAIAAVAKISGTDLLPSMEIVNGAMKPFNDGLYAAIELGVEEGVAGAWESKLELLQAICAKLEAAYATAPSASQEHLKRAMVFLGAAVILGGGTPKIIPSALIAAKAAVLTFKKENPLHARPIGFYTWNEGLGRIFGQDRFLQNDRGTSSVQEFGLFSAIAAIVEGDTQLKARYESLLALYAGLTNTYASFTAVDLFPYMDGIAALENVASIASRFMADHKKKPYVCKGTYFAFVPASRSKEMDYFSKKYCTTSPGLKTNLMNELITAIRDGSLSLEPDARSGWYDYQVYALETLLLPEKAAESQHLLLTAAYKKKLVETFKSIITQTRETHVKQLEMGTDRVSMPVKEVDLYPKFPVEPFPTFYLRSARAYRFVGTYLESVLGETFMTRVHRLNEDGSRSKLSLKEELKQMTRLLYGLYVLTARAVGNDPRSGVMKEELAEYPEAECLARAETWIASWKVNPDILKDPRVVLPMWDNSDNAQIIYWAILGVKVVRISTHFVKGHEPKVRSGYSKNEMCALRDFVSHDYYLLMEQMEQVRISDDVAPPTREEFRKIC